VFAILGNILFFTLTSFETFRSSTEFHYAEHKVVEARPRLQWLAQELQKISIELQFHVAFTNPATQMNLLRAAAEDHQARALVFGNGVYRGFFVIKSIQDTHQQLADDGSYVATSARLELQEWVPGADFDPAAPPRTAAPAPGIVPLNPHSVAVFDPNQPVSALNPLPPSSICQLTSAGVQAGVTYSRAAYQQPGVSAVIGLGPVAAGPGTPSDVLPSTIVRAG
jgi:phage protein U